MSNFWTRTVTGLSMVFLLLVALALSHWLLVLILFTVSLLGLWEFYTIFTSETTRPQRLYGTICGGFVYLSIALLPGSVVTVATLHPGFIPVLVMIPALFLPFVLELFRKQQNPLVNIAITITGFLYISVPMAMLILMNGEDVLRFLRFPVLLTGFFILTWFYDTGAYLFGKQFGKHKLAGRISPNKTREGTLAGAAAALLAAAGLHFTVPAVSLADWLVIAILTIVFGTAGDLVESLFKRSIGIKDSGGVLPGHGGILDRFDSILISVPFVFLYLAIRNLI